MAKSETRYICTSCDAVYPAWQGKCTSCGQWNTIVRDNFDGSGLKKPKVSSDDWKTVSIKDAEHEDSRMALSIDALNNVLSGGVIEGQVILFAGEPGIGKSTLLTQICANSGLKTLYISGEESVDQISKRAKRIASIDEYDNSEFSDDTNLESITAQIQSKNYDLVIIDSIQTVHSNDVSGFPGSMNQIRECAGYITDYAKKYGVTVIMIGQITKEGSIAGPKILEHMVDTVLYFEGDRKNDTRILRVNKNRFGSTSEIAIFEMKENGLHEIRDIEKYFIDSITNEEGVAYTIYQEGSVSFLLEIQALCTKSSFAYPKRVSNGFDSKRLEMMIAILSKKLGLRLEDYDIYVSVVGGIKVEDTSADLAVAAAIVSSYKNKALPKACFLGEVSLIGEIRSVGKQEQRIKKAKKLGFKTTVDSLSNKNLDEIFRKK